MTVILQDVSVHYGQHVAVDRASITATNGRVLALVGPNGSGKSSLLKAVAGIVPHTGTIKLPNPQKGSTITAYMPQQTNAMGTFSVTEVVLLGRLPSLALRISDDDLDKVADILGELGLLPLAGRMIGELSGGQRQLVFLAQALVSAPRVLLLDEPISALDLRHQLEVLEMTRHLTIERDLTTIVVLHDLNAASRYADDIVMISNGRIAAAGRPQDVLLPEPIRRVFGVEVELATLSDGWPLLAVKRTSKL